MRGQILYDVETSYVDKSLKYQNNGTGKSLTQIDKEAHDIICRLTGDYQYQNFGPMINDALQKLYPDAGYKITGAKINNWILHDFERDPALPFDHDPILPNGICPGFTVETDRELSDEQRIMLVDAVNNQITELLSDTFEPVQTKAETLTLSGRINFDEIWDPDKVKQYFEAKEKKEQEKRAFLKSVKEKPVEDYSDFADAVAGMTDKKDLNM